MDGSLIINVLVYSHNGGSPVTSQIDFKTKIYDSPWIILVVWQLIIYGFIHLVVHQKPTKDMIYTPMGGL